MAAFAAVRQWRRWRGCRWIGFGRQVRQVASAAMPRRLDGWGACLARESDIGKTRENNENKAGIRRAEEAVSSHMRPATNLNSSCAVQSFANVLHHSCSGLASSYLFISFQSRISVLYHSFDRASAGNSIKEIAIGDPVVVFECRRGRDIQVFIFSVKTLTALPWLQSIPVLGIRSRAYRGHQHGARSGALRRRWRRS